ncbi:hypothetical protein JCM15764A_12160 [Geotalea toluenoxydans]
MGSHRSIYCSSAWIKGHHDFLYRRSRVSRLKPYIIPILSITEGGNFINDSNYV